jgi:hypothetical protein
MMVGLPFIRRGDTPVIFSFLGLSERVLHIFIGYRMGNDDFAILS